MAQTSHGRKPVSVLFPQWKTQVTIGEASDWDEALCTLYDYAERKYRKDFHGQWNNFGQLRCLCFDAMLKDQGIEEPKSWALNDGNSLESHDALTITIR